jgi:hypothetical protein
MVLFVDVFIIIFSDRDFGSGTIQVTLIKTRRSHNGVNTPSPTPDVKLYHPSFFVFPAQIVAFLTRCRIKDKQILFTTIPPLPTRKRSKNVAKQKDTASGSQRCLAIV